MWPKRRNATIGSNTTKKRNFKSYTGQAFACIWLLHSRLNKVSRTQDLYISQIADLDIQRVPCDRIARRSRQISKWHKGQPFNHWDWSIHHHDRLSSSCKIGWNTKQSRSSALFFGCSGVGADGRLASTWTIGEETSLSLGWSDPIMISSSIEMDRNVFDNANVGEGIKMLLGILHSRDDLLFSFPWWFGIAL